jgi:DNA-directed RNA polymerase specialized sigma24 family protein
MWDDAVRLTMTRGDEAAHARLFESSRQRRMSMVRNRIGRRLAPWVDAEGVLQDAYLRARSRWPAVSAAAAGEPQ